MDKFKQHLQANGHVFKSNGAVGNVDNKDIRSFFSSNEKEESVYQWVKWICCRNLPLSEVENEMTVNMVKHKSMSTKTLRKTILGVANETVKPISEELRRAGKITLLVDGWTCDGTSTHYIAIFAGYVSPVTGEYEEVLLAIQPTLDEESMDATAHIDLFESTLKLYGLTKDDHVICLVADNCMTNRSISRLWGIPMVGCASHRFNLAVKLWIKEQRGLEDALEKISVLMGKACNIKAAARLREATQDAHGKMLKAKKKNETRWTSSFTMLTRYLRIRENIETVEGLEEYALSKREYRVVVEAQEHFEIFEDITIALQ